MHSERRLRRSVVLTGGAPEHWRGVEALGEAERPGNERLHAAGIGMEWVHQHDVGLWEDLRAHCRQQAAALLEPVAHPVADRIVVRVGDPLRNRIDLSPTKDVIIWRIGRIARQVPQGDQHRKSRFGCEVHDRHAER